MCGNATEPADIGEQSRKSSLFFLTTYNPGISLAGDRVYESRKYIISDVSGACTTILENAGVRHLFSILSVLISASGLQGEQPLVDRTM